MVVLLATGIGLTRGLPVFELRDPEVRSIAYWAHVATPFLVGWLFVLHRLAGRRIRWAVGAAIGGASLAVGVACMWLVEPQGMEAGADADFLPSLVRTSTGGHIASEDLMRDDQCAHCHADAHAQWQYSAHRFASFNNRRTSFPYATRARPCSPATATSTPRGSAPDATIRHRSSAVVSTTRGFDDVNDPTAHAGITCVACHAIEAIGSVRGNADYVIGIPERYPFGHSDNPVAMWVNRFLVKAKPALHKRTFLKPVHKTRNSAAPAIRCIYPRR